MKRSIFIAPLTLGLLLFTLPVFYAVNGTADSKSNQNVSSSEARKKPTRVFSLNGKRLRDDQRYVAQRTLPNGRIIAYRRHKREIDALVKALREDGVTDAEMLDPKTWMSIVCDQSIRTGCTGGCSPTQSCVHSLVEVSDQRISQRKQISLYGYCRCG